MQENQRGYCSDANKRPWERAGVQRKGVHESGSDLWGSQQQKIQKDLVTVLHEE